MTKRPNILWIITDQQRADTLGCITPWMHTPALDQLAAQGAHIRDFFTQSPVCVPSRINYITGRYPHSHRNRENNARVAPGEPHIFRVLKTAGYQTAVFGKNHMFYEEDLPKLHIDGTRVDNLDHMNASQVRAYKDHLAECRRQLWDVGCWTASFHDFPEELTRTHQTGAAAVNFLKQVDTESPFFLWVSFADPHVPHTAPRRFSSYYPLDKIPVPEGALAGEFEAEVRGKPTRQAVKRKAQGMVNAPEHGLLNYIAVYSAMISFVDEWVGRILDALAKRGLVDNTLVVFVSDHGDFLGEHGMVKKDLVLYDSLLHVPCIMRYPGHIKSQTVKNTLVEQIDLYPTILDYANIERPKGVQGVSIRSLLEEKTKQIHSAVYAEICPPLFRNPYKSAECFLDDWQKYHTLHGHPLQWTAPFNVPGEYVKAVRTLERKYVWYASGEEELYDLIQDPGETHNFAGDARYAADKASLKVNLLEWHALTEDPLDESDVRRFTELYPW